MAGRTNKTKTVTLSYPEHHGESVPRLVGYGVVRVTDSVEYAPGQIVTREEAERLCSSDEWKVTLVKRGDA